jgi:hypothetical protein
MVQWVVLRNIADGAIVMRLAFETAREASRTAEVIISKSGRMGLEKRCHACFRSRRIPSAIHMRSWV